MSVEVRVSRRIIPAVDGERERGRVLVRCGS